MGAKSTRKGASGEREVMAILRDHGYLVERGGTQSYGQRPDLYGLSGLHLEIKRSERSQIWEWHPKEGWNQTIELSRKENGFGGNQAFFLCPACGERRRYLYQLGAAFLCRKCAQLNYRSQQETRSGSMYFYDKAQ